MPLRLRAYTQRRREQERKDHDETDLQSTLSGDKVQNGGGPH